MKKTMQIDLDSKDDLFERYNRKKVSKDLIRYMIGLASKFNKDDEIEVVINDNFGCKEKCVDLIKKALKEEYASNEHRFHKTNIKQITFFIFGATALAVSTLIKGEIIKELILIGAWVFIWDMVELEIDDDMSNRKRKRNLKKLLDSKFVENKID